MKRPPCSLRSLPPALAAAAMLAMSALPAEAAPTCTAASGPEIVPLVELFTSEGCDSCPPADRWLSAQFPKTGGGASILAFHVDYWDRLGWKDRFATPAYTERQYTAMHASRATFVYTPQLLVQGRDAEVGRGNRAQAMVAAARKQPARATIGLDATAEGDASIRVRVQAKVADAASRRNAVVWLAYTDSGLVSDVKAGENRGVRLAHDHVVRALMGPYAIDADGSATITATFARPSERGRDPSLVAVVQDTKNGDVLQTLTAPACGGV